MNEPIHVDLFHKPDPDSSWGIIGDLNLPPQAIPRIGDAFRYRHNLWRVLDVVWDFERLAMDGSGAFRVDLNVEPGSE
jgi:hypothetical protein